MAAAQAAVLREQMESYRATGAGELILDSDAQI
jgi:hypothetical protein